jgi:hypothetical protein
MLIAATPLCPNTIFESVGMESSGFSRKEDFDLTWIIQPTHLFFQLKKSVEKP